MNERLEKAKKLHSKGYNCAQSVLAAYSDLLGVEEDLLLAVANGFGGGMGGMQLTCGAVTGMFMVAGLQRDKQERIDDTIKVLAKEFETRNQSLICSELKGNETKKALKSCGEYIEDGVRIVGKYLFSLDETEEL